MEWIGAVYGGDVIVYKQWAPDQPELNSDVLLTANNVIPDSGSYSPFRPLEPVRSGSFTLPGIPSGGFVAELEYPNNPAYVYYAATSSRIYMANPAVGSGTFNSVSTGMSTASPINDCNFAQYGSLVYAARGIDGIQVHTAGSASNFTTVAGLTGSRDGRYIFTVGQFLVVANLGSATARVGGYGGDQYAIVVQTGAITRMTYVGPPVVFQFDRIDQKKGQQRRYGGAASGQIVYFQSSDGFWKTDGVSNVSVGDGRVNKTFLANAADDIGPGAVTAGAMMDCAFHHVTKQIYWSFPVGSTTNSNKLYIYSTSEDKWTSADQVMRTFIEPSPSCHKAERREFWNRSCHDGKDRLS